MRMCEKFNILTKLVDEKHTDLKFVPVCVLAMYSIWWFSSLAVWRSQYHLKNNYEAVGDCFTKEANGAHPGAVETLHIDLDSYSEAVGAQPGAL